MPISPCAEIMRAAYMPLKDANIRDCAGINICWPVGAYGGTGRSRKRGSPIHPRLQRRSPGVYHQGWQNLSRHRGSSEQSPAGDRHRYGGGRSTYGL